MCKLFVVNLLVVAVVEGAVCDSHVGLGVVAVGIFAITVEQGLGGQEVSLFEEVTCIWHLHLVL
jgi:hypothetical protein